MSSMAQNATELQTFLPKGRVSVSDDDLSDRVSTPPHQSTVVSFSQEGKEEWDPFRERRVEHPTTDCETLTHFLKASVGTGIFAMPLAFKNSGMTMGIVLTVLVSVICTHCSYILVKCAHDLSRRTRVASMSFADVGEAAFANGPSWTRPYSKLARCSIIGGVFVAYFGSCSVYTVIIAQNFQQVIEQHTGNRIDIRIYISVFLIPLVILSWIPNLKYLAPVSMVANILMGVGLGITIYYLSWDLPSPSSMPQISSPWKLPQFFSITIFAMEAIGAVMALENNMKNPEHFIGVCGVLNKGMSGVTVAYILMGFLGYLKYGDEVLASVTLNLPTEDFAAKMVKILVALAVCCTYALTYYVCLQIVWNAIKDKFHKNTFLAEYLVRTLLTTAAVLLAVAVPTIGPFMGLLGALCFSFLGLMVPVVIEFATYWESGYGPFKWMIWKNILLLVFGFLALFCGSYTSVQDIFKEYNEASLNPIPTFIFQDVHLNITSK